MNPQRQSTPWVYYNENTATYDTPDGTRIPAEIPVECLADVLRISHIRAAQRAAIKAATTHNQGTQP